MIYQTNKNRIYEEMEILKAMGDLMKAGRSLVCVDKEGIDLKQENMQEILDKTDPYRGD